MPPESRHVPPPSMDAVAESYVKLVLAVGLHDASYVDAYYGPQELKAAAEAENLPLDRIRARALELRTALPAEAALGDDEMPRLRRASLDKQLAALAAHVDRLGGKTMTFDEESLALYDAVAPRGLEERFREILRDLEGLLPGPGPLVERYEAFRERFLIPKGKLDTVFRAASDACRERTVRRLELPPGESFEIEYVTGKPWSGYDWYQGGYRSLIQVNTDLPISIDHAVDLACHEGYPGHHVYNALLERSLTRGRGWVEYSVYPLYSPQSLIAEGTANFGIEMAFPGEERAAYERETLYPLAGLDPARAGLYQVVLEKVQRLGHAENEVARLFLRRRHRCRGGRGPAHDVVAVAEGPRRAAPAVHPDLPGLRHHLQPGKGPGAVPRRGEKRRRRGAPLGGLRRAALLPQAPLGARSVGAETIRPDRGPGGSAG